MLRFLQFVFFVILVVLCLFWSVQAEASTYRPGTTYQIQFDIIKSEMNFGPGGELLNVTEGRMVDPSSEEYTAVVVELHTLRVAFGQTGPVTFDLQVEDWPQPERADLSCVSGFLCSTMTFSRPFAVNLWGYSYPDNVGFVSIFPDPFNDIISLNGNTLSFLDDSLYSSGGIVDGVTYMWPLSYPQVTFTLANLTTTELASVPLPAAATALAAGLLALGAFRMRRRGRQG